MIRIAGFVYIRQHSLGVCIQKYEVMRRMNGVLDFTLFRYPRVLCWARSFGRRPHSYDDIMTYEWAALETGFNAKSR